ncbi:hypothetical protein ACWHA6_36340 [Streptomyces anthocyanicus]
MTDDLLDEATRLAGDYADYHHDYGMARVLNELIQRVQQAEADVAEYAPILDRQGELLTGAANALRGDPPPLTTWSHHDLPELAAEARGKLDKVRDICDQANEGMPLVTFGGHVQSHRINVDDVLAILDEETGQRDTEPMADTNERPDEHSRVSTELGREEIRPWTLDPERYVLEFDGYEVDLERMRTSAEALDWIFQVAGKAWASDKVIAGLIFAIEGLLHPQESLCSGGGSKSMTEGEIRARIDDHADEFTD